MLFPRADWTWLLPVGGLAFGVVCGCARSTGATRAAQATPPTIRFGIEVGDEAAGPIYVTLGGSDGGPGWVWATREGERVYLHERCDIGDCGKERAVCGAPVPLVRDLTASGDRRVEFVWDGMTSVVDSAGGGCEIRQPARPGAYAAILCYSREVETNGPPNASGIAQGRLLRPTCVERAFSLADREVVLRI